jgi:hypothetical protein
MDLNRIGFAVGIIALFLAIPLAIVANLLTPLVRDWYSTSSQRRLHERLAKLQERLRSSEQGWTFTPAEWQIYRDTGLIARIALAAFHGIFTIVLLLLILYRDVLRTTIKTHSTWNYWELVLLVLLMYSFNIFLAIRFLRRYDRSRTMHSTIGREDLTKEIARLMKRREL